MNHLWQSTLFAGVIWLLTLMLRRNPARVRYWLWFAASVKFLVPFSLFVTIGNQAHWRTATAAPPQVPIILSQIAEPLPTSSQFLPGSPTHPFDPLPILLAIWASGFTVIMIRWVRETSRVRTILRRAISLQLPIPVKTLSSPVQLEPGVFGIFRPILLLPEGIADRLTADEFRAVVAHELCHVRRRDNLFAAIHMFIEALLWFHPLIWWIGHRMVYERERACDEAVLLQGSDPEAYAEGILKVCELYLESPLACIAGISGANLKQRIEAIMTHRTTQNLGRGKKLLLAAASISAMALPLSIGMLNALPARAQATRSADTPAFEVASVKPCSPDDPGGRSGTPIAHGRMSVSCTTVMDLMSSAYVSWANGRLNSPKWLRIERGPAWIKSDRYTINAKSQADAPFEMLTGPMLQLLLEDRFKLKTHRETREIPVYNLTVAKGGPKMKPVPEGSCTPFDQVSVEKLLEVSKPGAPKLDVCGISNGTARNGSTLKRDFHALTLTQFGTALPVDRPVIDKTGISGMFDFHLEFALDDTTRSAVPQNSPAAALADDPSGPSIFTALQDQLGLKLEPSKGPGEFLVIDSVERPTEN